MAIRGSLRAAPIAVLIGLAGCGEPASGPIAVSAIGAPPRVANPNLERLDPPSAYLLEAVAQGLVRFDQAGEIEPALAQSWIVSDDGRRYTFRLRRAQWEDGSIVTARQVAARLRAALSRASRNQLKPVLGAIETIVGMTDFVLEISLRGPRANFLQLLAHPEMAVLQGAAGTGPYRLAGEERGALRLSLPRAEDEEAQASAPDILLRGEGAATAIARFAGGEIELVVGGTAGDLPLTRAADLANNRLVFDPVGGLFGLAFTGGAGALEDPALRRALAMAVDRQEIAVALDVPRLAPRTALVAPGVLELPAPIVPDWAASPLPMRRELAAQIVGGLGLGAPLAIRVAMPEGPGYRILFAHLRRDWRMIGIEATRVAIGQPAELVLVDEVAPANLASWYLRRFTCDVSPVCDPAADQALLAARLTTRSADRNAQFAIAERILTDLVPFIPLTAPVRWSLASPRLTGFRPSPFARHPAVELVAERP